MPISVDLDFNNGRDSSVTAARFAGLPGAGGAAVLSTWVVFFGSGGRSVGLCAKEIAGGRVGGAVRLFTSWGFGFGRLG